MTYELVDPTRRKTLANEYLNTTTGQFEVIKRHGLYDVQETFLTPEGRVLLLAFNSHAAQPFVVGIYKSDHGLYWREGADARRHYAWQIALSFGLTVDREGSKAVTPASRQYATDLCKDIKAKSGEYQEAVKQQDEFEQEKAAGELEEKAVSLAKHFQRIGVLSETVYERWEAVG